MANACFIGSVQLMDAKLAAMKSVHLVIPDLFLPQDFAAEVCADLALPALRKLLARGTSTTPLVLSAVEGSVRTDVSGSALENRLCELFGVPRQLDAPIAPLAAAFDGLNAGDAGWFCAAPTHLRLQRDQLLLLTSDGIEADEAMAFCSSLNEYFAGQGMAFHAPHPQRWYVRVEQMPDISSVPLSQVSGRNIRNSLPSGADAARWHQLFNEIQMLLFAHPLNDVREARGLLPVNSLWLWGGGAAPVEVAQPYDCVSSDEVLAEMFAAAAGVKFSAWQQQWHADAGCDRQLLVWSGLCQALQHGDFQRWREAVQRFETGYAQPLWQALSRGAIDRLQIEASGGDRLCHVQLTRADTWAFWRRSKRLTDYSLV